MTKSLIRSIFFLLLTMLISLCFAACNQDGVLTYTCSVCSQSYIEPSPLPVYTATVIHERYLPIVGEILTYDKRGNELSLGTCFVYSADGTLITNYHVIENGYSAKVTLDGKVYDVTYILAYDKTIDIAVLKINDSNEYLWGYIDKHDNTC